MSDCTCKVIQIPFSDGHTIEVPAHAIQDSVRFVFDEREPVTADKIVFALSIAYACGAMRERQLTKRPLIPVAGPGLH